MPRPTTMNLSEAVSASSLWAHKLRSVLTLIGVVIGVAAVIAVLFGVYPAWKAARLDLVEAPRYE